MAGADANSVKELIDELKRKYASVMEGVQADREKKQGWEREMVKKTDELEDCENILRMKQKLHRQYSNSLDEADMAIKNMKRNASKFEAAFSKVGKKDQAPASMK